MSTIGSTSTLRLQMPLTARLKQGDAQAVDGPKNFIELVQAGVSNVNQSQQSAAAAIEKLLTGGDVSEAEVFTSVQKADMSFRMLVQVRNKLMQAYEEINAIRI